MYIIPKEEHFFEKEEPSGPLKGEEERGRTPPEKGSMTVHRTLNRAKPFTPQGEEDGEETPPDLPTGGGGKGEETPPDLPSRGGERERGR